MKRFYKPIVFTISLLMFVFSCNRQEMNAKKETASGLYKQGLRFLKNVRAVDAEIAFNKALQIKEKYAPAYEGLARVYLLRGQLHKAENFAKKSINLNKGWLPARIVMARIYLAEGAYDLSRDELQLALKHMLNRELPNLKSEIYALLSQNNLQQKNFIEAEKNGKQALTFKADNVQALEILDEIKEILGHLKGRGQVIQDLAAKSVITRADLAILLYTELGSFKFFKEDSSKRNQIKKSALDVKEGDPAFDAVNWNLRHHLLPLLPDSTFRPNDKVDRAEMTLFLQGILKVLFPDSLYSLPFTRGMHAYFDVDSSQPYFKALQTISSLRLMESKDKYFRARHTVSGLEAIKSIDRLKEIMRELSFH